jgi:hypothetical protein
VKLCLVVGWIVVAAAGPLSAQDPRLGRLDPAAAAEVGQIVAAARGSGLPVEPLVDRALEGASKGATSARIVAAVRALAHDLAAARAALGVATAEADVTAGAGALRAGATPATLTGLREARPDAPLTVPLGVLADLIARGVPPQAAASAVLTLARHGAPDAEYVALRRNVERDILAGAPPAVAAAVRARGMPSTLPPAPPSITTTEAGERTLQAPPRPRRP